jgi:two-component sensor histidine kinase
MIVITFLLAATTILNIFFFRLFRKNRKTRKKRILLREQNHRVKNNLQLISSLLSMQTRQLSDLNAKKAVQESQLRLHSMLIIQKKLYNHGSETSIEVADFIAELAHAVLTAGGYELLKPVYQIERFRLEVELA